MASQKSGGNTSLRTLAHCAHFTSAAPQSEMEKCVTAKARRRSAALRPPPPPPTSRDRTPHFNSSDSANTSRGTARRNTGMKRAREVRRARDELRRARAAPVEARVAPDVASASVAWKVSGSTSIVDVDLSTPGTEPEPADTRHVRKAYRRDRRRRRRRRPRPRPSRAPTLNASASRAASAAESESESVVFSLQKSGAGELPADAGRGGGFRARRREDIRGRDSVQVGERDAQVHAVRVPARRPRRSPPSAAAAKRFPPRRAVSAPRDPGRVQARARPSSPGGAADYPTVPFGPKPEDPRP